MPFALLALAINTRVGYAIFNAALAGSTFVAAFTGARAVSAASDETKQPELDSLEVRQNVGLVAADNTLHLVEARS